MADDNWFAMKFLPVKIIFLSLIILFTTGCKKNNIINDKQKILFQFEYVNYAWGYQHNGFFIDNDGNVLTYNKPENWNFPDNDRSIGEIQVLENLGKCSFSGTRIGREEFQKYTNFIKNIASSKITAMKNVAADAGSYEYICYQYSGTNQTYKGYLIKMEGDFSCENLNFYSKKVVLWMKEIEKNLPKN
jgi:hypothetical protein